MKKIALLGSTGSIGESVLSVLRHLNSEEYQLVALAAHSNIEKLYEQALEFKPKLIAVFDEAKALELQKKLPHIPVLAKEEGVIEVARFSESNFMFNAIVGTSGLLPMMAAIESKKTIALANKEVLVSAGELIMSAIKKNNTQILPVDSEHSALFQCLQNQPKNSVHRLIITASGGPFLNHSLDDLKKVTLKDALNHPTWTMGSKITIDSSTLMNKGFEVIEAKWLFDIPIESIDVVIHPQSIVHSFVEFVDNTILAQMGEPQMLTPIQLALTYPQKCPGMLKPFDFTQHSKLEFYQPDFLRFKCLQLAYDALKLGDSYACFLNATNEILVKRFLQKEISWYDISSKLQMLMDKHKPQPLNSIDEVLSVDHDARQKALIV